MRSRSCIRDPHPQPNPHVPNAGKLEAGDPEFDALVKEDEAMLESKKPESNKKKREREKRWAVAEYLAFERAHRTRFGFGKSFTRYVEKMVAISNCPERPWGASQ